jgi:hypothetical protein
MPEVEENLVTRALKGSKLIDVKTNTLSGNRESENSVTKLQNTEQRS